ncbi:MAG: hypothetical protein OXU20_07020 [Myxococcales bacterium]|nr:hypothetical protein [Myxococcales bacterium]
MSRRIAEIDEDGLAVLGDMHIAHRAIGTDPSFDRVTAGPDAHAHRGVAYEPAVQPYATRRHHTDS